jgi:hypothetical protein
MKKSIFHHMKPGMQNEYTASVPQFQKRSRYLMRPITVATPFRVIRAIIFLNLC